MDKILKSINDFVDSHKEEMVDLWKDIVNIESYAREKNNVDNVAERLKNEFESIGMDCELIDVGENSGKTLVGSLGLDRQKKPVIFSGHMDTVFPENSFGENPFYIEEGRAYGPGVLDMKGGIIIALYTIKALNHIGYNERPIKIVFSGDEEIGHINSRGSEVICDYSEGGVCAFNLETGLIDNTLCVGRKGRIECHITTEGVSSHAGNDFKSGRNAIEEMCYKVIEIQKLTDFEEGTTYSVGTIKGGSVSNAVPEMCTVAVDIRFEKSDAIEKIKSELTDICSKTHVEGTSTELKFANVGIAFETTPDVLKFYEVIEDIVKEYDLPKIDKKTLGGRSDASYITEAGVPVVCSFGVRGQFNHTNKEYAVVDSIFERVQFISTIVVNLNKYYID